MDIATVRKVARLARIETTDAELETVAPRLAGIMKWIEQLAEVNTDNVAPMASTTDSKLFLRADAVTDGDCQDKVLANAPEASQGYFVVPKVVE